MNEDRKANYTEVLVTEVTDEGKFYASNVSDGTALEKLMDNWKEEFTTNPPLSGTYQPKKNKLCAAKFIDDQWHSANVKKIGISEVQTPGGYAKPYSLALTDKTVLVKDAVNTKSTVNGYNSTAFVENKEFVDVASQEEEEVSQEEEKDGFDRIFKEKKRKDIAEVGLGLRKEESIRNVCINIL